MRKRYTVALAALAALAGVFAMFGAAPAGANPPGIGPVGKKLDNFNLIVHPHSWDNLGNACNGSRIFFAQDTAPWTLTWNFVPNLSGPSFQITDCNATTDGGAAISEDAGIPVYIFLRVLGPKTSSLGIVCQDVVDVNGVNECLIASANLGKSKSFTKITSHLADTMFSQVLWTLDPSTNFKIAQVDVFAQS
jgi:hypothetical protein